MKNKSRVKKNKKDYSIQAVAHALVVLEELARSRGEQGVTELAKLVSLHKNNVFRVLATLELFGYVKQNPETEQYSLGVKSLHLGQSYLAQNSIYERAGLAVRSLQDRCAETVSYAVLAAGHTIYPLSIEAKRTVRCPARVAASIVAKQSATGKLLLATQNQAEFTDFVNAIPTSEVSFVTQMKELRNTSYIIDRGVIETDVLNVSKVIRSGDGSVLGALEVCSPMYRGKAEEILATINDVIAEFSFVASAHKKQLKDQIEKDSANGVSPESKERASTNTQIDR